MATGTDFDYLLTTAARESNFKPDARAKTSSAAGLFQFIESTWLQTVKEQGGRFGLEKYSPHIFQTESGRFYVPNREIRQEILNLRHNPEVSALMAGAFTQRNAEYVGERLGRDPTQGELYIAHFLGAGGATKLITLASKNPDARADNHFPRAAKANRSIFYSHRQARSVQQVYDQLVSDHSRLGATALDVSTPGQSRFGQSHSGQSHSGQARSGVSPVAAHPNPALRMSVLDTPPGPQALRTGAHADAPTTVAPMSRTRVAALYHSPIPVAQAGATDPALGGIGSWNTIVQLGPGAVVANGASEITPAEASGETFRHFRTDPDRVPLRSSLHGGAPQPAPAHVSAAPATPQPEPAPVQARRSALENFSSRFWELQALTGA